jgi:hypothetical protein
MVPVVAGAASNATTIDEKDTSIPSLSDTPKVTNTTDNNQGASSQDFKMAFHFFVTLPDVKSSSEIN